MTAKRGDCMGFVSRRNFRHNEQIPLPAGLINGQSLGAVSGMKYGFSTVSYSGCECIAVYNALVLSGRPQPFPVIARYMERFRVMGGFWGANFLSLGHCLRHFGLRARRVRRRSRLTEALGCGKVCLAVYWTGKRFCSPVHTVCVRRAPTGDVMVCNMYNSCGTVLHEPIAAFPRKHLIFAYIAEESQSMTEV